MSTNGLTWGDRKYTGDQLPEFLCRLRSRRRHEPRRVAEPAPGRVGEVRDDADRAAALARGRHADRDLRPRRGLRLAQPSRLPDRHGRLGPGRPLRHRLLDARPSRQGQTFYETAAQDVHRQEPERDRPGGRQRDVRRPRRHADDGAPRRQATAQRLHAVSRRVAVSGRAERGGRARPPLFAVVLVAVAVAAALRRLRPCRRRPCERLAALPERVRPRIGRPRRL